MAEDVEPWPRPQACTLPVDWPLSELKSNANTSGVAGCMIVLIDWASPEFWDLSGLCWGCPLLLCNRSLQQRPSQDIG